MGAAGDGAALLDTLAEMPAWLARQARASADDEASPGRPPRLGGGVTDNGAVGGVSSATTRRRKSREQPFAWDPDEAIYSAVALSRLVHPNTISTEYAARVICLNSGALEVHPGPVTRRSANAWAHESIKKRWLTRADSKALAVLLATYWPIQAALPRRLRNAFWHHEYATQTRDPNVRLVLVATALEALVHTDRFKSTAQFGRVAQLAAEVGLFFSTTDADDAYDLRSHFTHGDRLASLLDSSDEKQCTAQEQRMNALLVAMEAILRKAIRRGIEDPVFRSVFEDAERIRARWPI